MTNEERFLDNNPLFKECIEALNVSMLPWDESQLAVLILENHFPITLFGKIDWDKVKYKIEVGYEPHDIIPALEKLLQGPFDTTVYIVWDSALIPPIKADLHKVIEHFDDVTCVSFDKFIFNVEKGYMIEVLPSFKITVGVIPLTSS